MIKITGGNLKGRVLISPKNKNIRPTPSIVKSAVFDILNIDASFDTVLDLFAGTGAFGFEALSRQSDYIYFIDKSPAACSIIKKNIANLGVQHQTSVLNIDAKKVLSLFQRKKIKFSLIFVDPPYKNIVLRDFILERISILLEINAYVLVEYSSEYQSPPDVIGDLIAVKTKHWGETFVKFYKINTNNDSNVLSD